VAKIYKLFSQTEQSPKTHDLTTANQILPLIRRYTEEAIEETEDLAAKIAFQPRSSTIHKKMSAAYDRAVMKWVDRIHRLGGVAKGLWLVDFDTGAGYLCWAFPEERVEHFHDYQGGFGSRVKIESAGSLSFESRRESEDWA